MTMEEMEQELTKKNLQLVALSKGLRWLADKMACMGERPLIDGEPICALCESCPESGCAGCWGGAALYATSGDSDLWLFQQSQDAPKMNAETIKAGFKANALARARR